VNVLTCPLMAEPLENVLFFSSDGGTAGERSCFPYAGRAAGERSCLWYADIVRESFSWARSFFTSKAVLLSPLLVPDEGSGGPRSPRTRHIFSLVPLYLPLALWGLIAAWALPCPTWYLPGRNILPRRGWYARPFLPTSWGRRCAALTPGEAFPTLSGGGRLSPPPLD